MPDLQTFWIIFRSASWALHLGNRIASCLCILHTVHEHNDRSTSLTFVPDHVKAFFSELQRYFAVTDLPLLHRGAVSAVVSVLVML